MLKGISRPLKFFWQVKVVSYYSEQARENGYVPAIRRW
jgi:hypothetical protein